MINKILVELAVNNSRNYKIELLQLHRDNGLLKDVIRLALDPFILFYIKKIPEYVHCSNELDLRSALIALEAIIERRITGNAAIQHLSDILSEVSEDDAEVIKRIINKDLRCGISNATVNVVWNNLIPVYPVMLASKFEQKLIDRLVYPVICQEKADGCLSSTWIIDTEDGKKTIKDIVESNYRGKVRGFNHLTQTEEYRNVINVSKSKTDKRWFVLTLANGVETPPLTGNHLIWISNREEYVRVDELTCVDFVQLVI